MICSTCHKEFDSLGIMRHRTIHYEDKQRAPSKEVMRHVSDRDCPKCGFPELVLTRDAKTLDLLRAECSKKTCHWNRKVEIKEAKPKCEWVPCEKESKWTESSGDGRLVQVCTAHRRLLNRQKRANGMI